MHGAILCKSNTLSSKAMTELQKALTNEKWTMVKTESVSSAQCHPMTLIHPCRTSAFTT